MIYKIMILDDDKFILASLKRLLHHKKNWQVDLYSDAFSALKQAENEPYHLFLSDYQMPQMDGMSFLTSIKKIQPDAIRVILSGDGDLGSNSTDHQQAGIFRFLNKPVAKDELITVIHEAFEKTP